MYENKTVENIHQDLLNNISDDYEKSTGFLVADLTKSFAIELKKAYNKVAEVLNKTDVDKLTGEELTRFIKQRKGINRKPAGRAQGILSVTGTGTINKGDLFETELGTQFRATETVNINSSGQVKIEAVITGSSGMVGANTITYLPITITGITAVTNNQTTGGYDQESDDSLRDRYYLALQKPPTSANIYHYLLWAREVTGVGDAKVFSQWNGKNTVKVLIIDDNKLPADQNLINKVQEHIDPIGENESTWGIGKGQAPIGAYCTVNSATKVDIDVIATIKLQTGFELTNVKEAISTKITEYLKEIAFEKNYISYAQITSLILDTNGVEEWTSVLLNNANVNVTIGEEEVAVLRGVTLNE